MIGVAAVAAAIGLVAGVALGVVAERARVRAQAGQIATRLRLALERPTLKGKGP